MGLRKWLFAPLLAALEADAAARQRLLLELLRVSGLQAETSAAQSRLAADLLLREAQPLPKPVKRVSPEPAYEDAVLPPPEDVF